MKPKIIIGLFIIITAATFLIFSGLKETSVYYLTISEARAIKAPPDRGIRVSGKVDPASIRWDADSLDLFFKLTENTDTLDVYYNGIIPDQLRSAQIVVAEGRLINGTLSASNILLKCPSKYEQKSVQGHLNAAESPSFE